MRTAVRFLALVLAPLFLFPPLTHAAKTHVVKRNETLYSLARTYRISVADLKRANGITGSQVKAGTKLVIPATEARSEHPARAPETYTDRKGDTLRKIAKKTGVSVFDIKRLNNITRNRVKPGQVLALREQSPSRDDDAPTRPMQAKLKLRHPELLKDPDSQAELEELIGREIAPDVDLSRSAELNPENLKLLKKAAYGFLGTRYRFGGTTRKGLDCSSFVQQVFREMDVRLPRTAREQYEVGERIPYSELQKGDLLFFRTYASFPSHVGIYLGNNRMIHASSRDRRVVISSLDTPYYRSRFIGAKRIDRVAPERLKLDEYLAQAEEELSGSEEENDTLGLSLDSLTLSN